MTADLSTTAGSLVAQAPAATAPGTGGAAGSLLAADVPSVVQSIDWLAIAPPTLTALAALVVLVADLFLPAHRKRLLGYATLTALAAALAFLIPLRSGDRSTFCVTTGAQACSYTADHFTVVIQVPRPRRRVPHRPALARRHPQAAAGEYWFLLLASASGAALLPASRDLATLVVALEVASLPAFALVGIKRGDRGSSEAALKFFLSSVVATAVMLLGVSFVYATTGTLHSPRSPPAWSTWLRSSTPSPRPAWLSRSSASPSRRPPRPSTSGSPTPTSARPSRSPPISPWWGRP